MHLVGLCNQTNSTFLEYCLHLQFSIWKFSLCRHIWECPNPSPRRSTRGWGRPLSTHMPQGTGNYKTEEGMLFLCFEIYLEPSVCSMVRDRRNCLVSALEKHVCIQEGCPRLTVKAGESDGHRLLRAIESPVHTFLPVLSSHLPFPFQLFCCLLWHAREV